jgi:hypothetical protein
MHAEMGDVLIGMGIWDLGKVSHGMRIGFFFGGRMDHDCIYLAQSITEGILFNAEIFDFRMMGALIEEIRSQEQLGR